MKTLTIIAAIVLALVAIACSSAKKAVVSTPPPVAAPVQPPASVVGPIAPGYVFTKPGTGIYAPGDEELAAIQVQYQEVTLEQLQEGHKLYTQGACIGCHGAKSIYQYEPVRWKNIIDDMAKLANITAAQKDAVYKYVLAIKAVQSKSATCKQH